MDKLIINGVNQRQEREIEQIKKMRRMIVANKMFEEIILNAGSVDELNDLIITGVSEENEFELIKLRNERINDIEDEVQSAAVEKYSNLISEATGVLELDSLKHCRPLIELKLFVFL